MFWAILKKRSLLFYYFSKTALFVFFNNIKDDHGLTRELGVFDTLDSLTKTKNQKPKFVYAHTLLPHAPFYLNDLGKYDNKVDDRNNSLLGIDNLVDKDPYNNTTGSPEADSLLKVDYAWLIEIANFSLKIKSLLIFSDVLIAYIFF